SGGGDVRPGHEALPRVQLRALEAARLQRPVPRALLRLLLAVLLSRDDLDGGGPHLADAGAAAGPEDPEAAVRGGGEAAVVAAEWPARRDRAVLPGGRA